MKDEEETFGAKSEKKKLANGDGPREQVDAEADPEEVEQLHSVEFINNWNVIKMFFLFRHQNERNQKHLSFISVTTKAWQLERYLNYFLIFCKVKVRLSSFFDWNLPYLDKYMHICTHFAQYCHNLTSGTCSCTNKETWHVYRPSKMIKIFSKQIKDKSKKTFNLLLDFTLESRWNHLNSKFT